MAPRAWTFHNTALITYPEHNAVVKDLMAKVKNPYKVNYNRLM